MVKALRGMPEEYSNRNDQIKAMTTTELWKAISTLTDRTFATAKGLPFTITFKGNELFVSRKEKSITRATVDMA